MILFPSTFAPSPEAPPPTGSALQESLEVDAVSLDLTPPLKRENILIETSFPCRRVFSIRAFFKGF